MRRVVIFVIGGTVLLTGIALLVLPGPALAVIPAGLAILAAEFSWARRALANARAAAGSILKIAGAASGSAGSGHGQNKA